MTTNLAKLTLSCSCERVETFFDGPFFQITPWGCPLHAVDLYLDYLARLFDTNPIRWSIGWMTDDDVTFGVGSVVRRVTKEQAKRFMVEARELNARHYDPDSIWH